MAPSQPAVKPFVWILLSSLALCKLALASTAAGPAPASAVISAPSAKLHIPGLHQPVRVLRDKWGVAHIYAKNQHDLFFAQGVVAAQDRLFQMELWKRAGQGRLSEILGESAVQRDISARALQYRGDMQAEYASYAADARAILIAFTDGINAYIATLGHPGGGELARRVPTCRFHARCLASGGLPQPHGGLFHDRQRPQRARRGPRAHRAGRAKSRTRAATSIRPLPWIPPPASNLSGLMPELLKNLVGSDQRIQFAHPPREGSNNWTISGTLTSSGKPLLANDPHRVLALPSLRYMVHLVAPGWNVIGAGEPGLPGVALGHNRDSGLGLYDFRPRPAGPLRRGTQSAEPAGISHRERLGGDDHPQ